MGVGETTGSGFLHSCPVFLPLLLQFADAGIVNNKETNNVTDTAANVRSFIK